MCNACGLYFKLHNVSVFFEKSLEKLHSMMCVSPKIHKSNSIRIPGESAPHHEERRHSNTQQKSFQQEQEEQEGRHAGAVLGGDPGVLSGRQQWALFPWPRDSPDLQPRTTPHPDPIPAAPLRLFTLHAPPQHWHGAHTGVKHENVF